MTDYRLTVKVQNNNILKRIYDAGYASVNDFCRRAPEQPLCESKLGEIINMKCSVFTKHGQFIIAVQRTASSLGCLPEDLFSEKQLEAQIETNVKTYEVSEEDMRFILEHQMEQKSLEKLVFDDEIKSLTHKALDTLTPRENKVLCMRMGINGHDECTLEEISKQFGVNRERIRQIEAKALRKLRHPSRSNELRQYFEEGL